MFQLRDFVLPRIIFKKKIIKKLLCSVISHESYVIFLMIREYELVQFLFCPSTKTFLDSFSMRIYEEFNQIIFLPLVLAFAWFYMMKITLL